uniref:Uncharacterized protein n=1 Tax=Arundo donax TaxID=35708 RepID=A0A0A9DY65_ARUDO
MGPCQCLVHLIQNHFQSQYQKYPCH